MLMLPKAAKIVVVRLCLQWVKHGMFGVGFVYTNVKNLTGYFLKICLYDKQL